MNEEEESGSFRGSKDDPLPPPPLTEPPPLPSDGDAEFPRARAAGSVPWAPCPVLAWLVGVDLAGRRFIGEPGISSRTEYIGFLSALVLARALLHSSGVGTRWRFSARLGLGESGTAVSALLRSCISIC